MSQRGVALFSRARGGPAGLPRVVYLVYALMLLNTMQFIAMVAIAPTYQDDLGLTKFQTSLILAVSGVGSAVLALPVGAWCNRFGVRPVALVGAGIVAATLWLQAFAPGLGWLLVARFIIGAGFCAVLSAAPAWIGEAAPAERQAAATAGIMVMAGIGLLLGPVLAGTLADAAGRATPMVVLSVLIGALVVVLALGPKHTAPPHGREPVLSTLKRARRSPLVVAGITLFGVGVLGENTSGTLVPLQLDRNGLSASAIGAVLSAGAAVFLVVSLVMARAAARTMRMEIAAAATGLLAVTMAILASSGSTPVTATGMILRTAVLAAMYTFAFPFAGIGAARVGIGAGAVFGAMQLAAGTANAIGPLLAGKIGESVGDKWAYILAIAVTLPTTVALWRAARTETGRVEPAAAAAAGRVPQAAGE